VKRRTKRDLLVFLAVIGVIGGFALANSQLSRRGLAEDFEKMRAKLEQSKAGTGIDLLKWKIVRTTKGSLHGGGTFTPDLMAYNGKEVFIIGFMVPEEQFRDVTEFLLLPIPIECYFCSMPPSRDVLFVKLRPGEKAQIYNEPVLIRGTFAINEGSGVKFFYSLQNATIESALDGGELTNRRLKLQHMVPVHQQDDSALLPGYSEKKPAQTE
jgi:hypothetical protein